MARQNSVRDRERQRSTHPGDVAACIYAGYGGSLHRIHADDRCERTLVELASKCESDRTGHGDARRCEQAREL